MNNPLPQLEDLEAALGGLEGKHILVRSDLNVPLDGSEIRDDFRIRQAVETWKWLMDRGAIVTACSHLGRPKNGPDPAFVMEPVAKRANELCPGVKLLENTRFNPGEKKNDPAYVQELIAGQDGFVLDAFGTAHREHASVVGPTKFLPSAAGRLLNKEYEMLGQLLENPPRPFVAILGGAKVSDKIGVIDALLSKVDTMIIGGGMAYTFLKAQGHSTGNSLLQEDQVDYCRTLLRSGKQIVLPTDLVVAESFDAPNGKVVGQDVTEGWEGLDIGPETRKRFAAEIAKAKTVFWNGPVGVFEKPQFAEGTKAVAEALASCDGQTIIGGGDVVSAVNGFGLGDEMSWVSTGGGASLEFIEKGDLPGFAALREASAKGGTK